MSDYPDYCIRGVRKSSFIHDDDTVSAAVYIPDNKTTEKRGDGGTETSINWEDNDTVLRFTLEMRDENNMVAFQHGAVKLPRIQIDGVNELASTKNTISYEREELTNNPFHGNIVFRAGLAKHTITMVATVLAAASSKVQRL